MKLRSVILLGLLVAFGLSLIAVAQEPVTVTFWHRFSASHEEALNQLSSDFHELYPYITVEWVYQGSYSALQQKINSAVVAGEVPTMTIFYENWIPPVVDALLPLDNLLSQELKDDIIDGLYGSCTFEGQLVTVPFNKSIMVFYYVKDRVPTPPTTWDELMQMNLDLETDTDGDGTIDQWGLGIRPASNPEQFFTLLVQNGGSILSDDWSEVTLGNEAGTEAATFYAELAQHSFLSEEYLDEHLDQCSMAIDTSAGYPYWVDYGEAAGLTIGVARVPAGPVNQMSAIQGTNIGIFKDAPQDQIDAAIKFVEFLLSGDQTAFFAIDSGYMPVTYSGYESQLWLDYAAEHPYIQVMTDQFADGFTQILHPNYGDMRDEVLSTFCEEIAYGAMTVEEAMAIAVAELEALLDY
jgi:multiple sugar transport system substrate-binding protein